MCFTTVCLSSSIRATFKDGCAGRRGGIEMCSSKTNFDIPRVTSGYPSNHTLQSICQLLPLFSQIYQIMVR